MAKHRRGSMTSGAIEVCHTSLVPLLSFGEDIIRIDGPIGYEDARGRTKGYFCLVLSLTRQPTCMGG